MLGEQVGSARNFKELVARATWGQAKANRITGVSGDRVAASRGPQLRQNCSVPQSQVPASPAGLWTCVKAAPLLGTTVECLPLSPALGKVMRLHLFFFF